MQKMAASLCSEHVELSLSREVLCFPLRALKEAKEAKEPKPDRLADNVIADPRPIPFQSELQIEGQVDTGEGAIDKWTGGSA